jgi:hypothetical protein
MSTKTEVIRDGAFVEPPLAPLDEDLRATIGKAFPILSEALAELHSIHPDLEPEWRFNPRHGWYQTWSLHDRPMFDLVPEHGAFRVSVVLSDDALRTLEHGPLTSELARVLDVAARTPEGTRLTFTADDLDLAVVIALFEAKIAA